MIKAYRNYWRGYADFRGRTSVGGYWLAVLAHLLASFALSFALGMLGQRDSMQSAVAYLTAFQLLCILPSLAILVRRLRDAGCAWTNLFWALLPIAGPIVLIVKLCRPSAPSRLSANRFAGAELGQWRIPAAILMLWGTLTVMASVVPGIGLPAGAQVRLNVFWWLTRFSLIALAVLLFIGKRNAGLPIVSGLVFLLSLRGMIVFPGVGSLLSTAAWAAVCLITAIAVFGRKTPPAVLLYLPAVLFLALGAHSLFANVTDRGFILFDIVVLADDALYAFGFFCLAKALAEKPRPQQAARASTDSSSSQASQRPCAAAGYSAQGEKRPGVLLVRFSIDKLNDLSGSYGFQSGRLIGQAVPAALLEGMTISDGDSAATLAGQEYVCVVSIASDDISFLAQRIEPLLQASEAIRENGASPLTQVVGSTREPLVADGVVRNGKIEGAGGWCASGFMSAWKEAAENPAEAARAERMVQAMDTNRTNNTESEGRATVMAKSGFLPEPESGYGNDALGMLLSVALIFFGASGQFVLRGTNSSKALVAAGFVYLAWDIISLVRKRSARQKAAEERRARSSRMYDLEKAVGKDKRALPSQANVRVVCEKSLAVLDFGARLNGSAMARDIKAREYAGATGRVRNILTFNNLDLTVVFDADLSAPEIVLDLFRDRTGIGVALPENATLVQKENV